MLAGIRVQARRLCGACFRANSGRIELACQRWQLANMPEWQRRDMGIDLVAAKPKPAAFYGQGGCRGKAILPRLVKAQKK